MAHNIKKSDECIGDFFLNQCERQYANGINGQCCQNQINVCIMRKSHGRTSVSSTGLMMAAAAAMTTVRIMILVPPEMFLSNGRYVKARLPAMEASTTIDTARFSFAAGMTTARNMPYSATESALTILKGRIFPTSTPRTVPSAHPGDATVAAP